MVADIISEEQVVESFLEAPGWNYHQVQLPVNGLFSSRYFLTDDSGTKCEFFSKSQGKIRFVNIVPHAQETTGEWTLKSDKIDLIPGSSNY